MAIGIAVAAQDGIVFASDEPANETRDDLEESVKAFYLSGGWRGLAAGEEPVIDGLHAALSESFEALDFADDEDDVVRALNRGLRYFKKIIIDIELKYLYGLAYDEFIEAAYLFPEEIHSAEIKRVRELPLDLEVIVAGFVKNEDGKREPRLFSIDSKWQVERGEILLTVGKASLFAEYALKARKAHREVYPLDETIYLAFEAKRLAESARSVSEQTALAVFSSDGTTRRSTPQVESQLASIYAKFGPRPLSTAIKISGLVDEQG